MNVSSHDIDGPVDEPLYVDLDGTLLKTDLLLEGFMFTLRHSPLRAIQALFWMLRGKAYLKARLAEYIRLEPTTLPYRQDFLDYLRECAGKRRRLVLATGSNIDLASQVADHLKLFDGVLASSTSRNLKGAEKLRAIVEDAGGKQFTYAGNEARDLDIWCEASSAVLVDTSLSVARRARRVTRIEREFPPEGDRVRAYFRAIRPHQWLKNVLVFLPLLAAQRWGDPTSLIQSLLAFVAFSLVASSVYVVNDLLDLPSDRRHPRKRMRPFASGAVPISHGLVMFPALLAMGIAVSLALNPKFVAILLLYVAVTSAYSLVLKTYVLVDVGTLAGLYTLRVIGGALALDVLPSFWLLAFSAFTFLSLALVKRCAELLVLERMNRESIAGRDYRASDHQIMQAIGVGAMMAAVVVLALYIDSPEVAAQYSRPDLLWLLCGTVVYAMARLWLKTARGEMDDDPLIFAVRDRGTLLTAAVTVLVTLAAI